MNCVPNWYTEVLEVADHDFAITLLKLKMVVKNSKELMLEIDCWNLDVFGDIQENVKKK